MQSSNPTLNERVFGAARVGMGEVAMTIQGTVNKTFVLLAILVATAMLSWAQLGNPNVSGFFTIGLIVAGIAGFILALVTSFNPKWSPITAPMYAACEGVVLGLLSAMFEMRYPGIVMQAVGLTFAVTLGMLLGYKTGWFQATPGLRKGIMIGAFGLMIFYGIVWIASMFGVHPPSFINGGGPLGIAFSLFVIGLAAMFLILDFDMIETYSREGMAQYMEWYCAFTLMVTLVWIYVEILRLLSKINRRD